MAQSASDVVFIDTLRLSATIGPDCWNKEREQPIEITLYLYLRDGFLKAAGESDDVLDSVHYGLLTKEITKLVRSEKSVYKSGDDLVDAVTKRAFDFAQDAVDRVRVVLAVPKIILLAESFALDVIIAKQPFAVLQKTVNVKDIVIPVIIGVNPPERESKQRVIVNITINEVPSLEGTPLDYPALVANLIKVGPFRSKKTHSVSTFSGYRGFSVSYPRKICHGDCQRGLPFLAFSPVRHRSRSKTKCAQLCPIFWS